MASERKYCKRPKGCGKQFSRPLGSRRIYCEKCSPPKPKQDDGTENVGPEPNAELMAAARVMLSDAGERESTDGLLLLEIVDRIAARRVTAMGLAQLVQAYQTQRIVVFGVPAETVDEGPDEIAQLFALPS